MAEDEFPSFDEMLANLERAAAGLGGSSDSDDPTNWFAGEQLFDERPRSLVDLRALRFDEPLSRHFTRPMDVTVEVEPGALIDHKYEIVGPAPRAAGGWEAIHVVLRNRFIVQLLARSIVDDPVMWPRFQQDIRAAGLLGHDNIEFVTDLGRCAQFGGYLVKQWIDGPTLEDWLAETGPCPVDEAIAFARTVGEALAALHEIGLIHGRLSPSSVRRVEESDGVVWKVLDVCVPDGENVLLAPEQRRGEGTGPEADQYAVAYLTWKLLAGNDCSLEQTPKGAPEKLVEVLRRALDDMPLMRWPDIECFLMELGQAAPTPVEPTIHPFDRREASRQVRLEQLGEAPSAPAGGAFNERPRSMMVRVVPRGATAGVEVVFGTGARLRREYLRNMLAGGLFVPTSTDLRVGGQALVTIRFTPREAAVEVDALVVTHDPGSDTRPRGYGVAFDGSGRQRVEEFVRALNVGLGMSPNDSVRVDRPLEMSAQLDAGSAFLLSRLTTGMTVGAARAMFSGLPYDFDECLSALIEQEYVSVRPAQAAPAAPAARPQPSAPAQAAAPKPTPKPAPPAPAPAPADRATPRAQPASKQAPAPAKARPKPLGDKEWSDVARVLETVAFFEEQGNFMAAGRVLQSATENAPDVAAFHHRLALVRAKFDLDLGAARLAIRAARRLAPDNQEIAASERYVETLVELAAVRVVWEGARTGSTRWLRTEPGLDRVWFENRTNHGPTVYEVDTSNGRVQTTSGKSGQRAVAVNAPAFDQLERLGAAPPASHRARLLRQLEISRRFGGVGPHFVAEPVPAAFTVNGTLVARTDGSLRVFRGETQLGQLSSSQEVRQPLFSPSEQYVAWTQPEGKKWVLHVAPITGPGTPRARFDAEPSFHWSDDSTQLIALDRMGAQLLAIDRRSGDPKPLLEVSGYIDARLIRSSDDDSVLLVARALTGGERWAAWWIDTRTGAVRGEYTLPTPFMSGVLRSDGKAVLVARDGTLRAVDLTSMTLKTLDTCRPVAESLAGSQWPVGKPLLVAEVDKRSARVVAIDVDLLCG